MPISLLQGRMGVCPLLLLLGLALGASAQDHVPVTSPPNITAKPTDPPAAPSLNITAAHTPAPTGPPTTLAVIPVTTKTTTTTTTSPAVDENVQPVGPNATRKLAPIPPPLPPAPTDAPQAPPSTAPPPPPTTEEEGNWTTSSVPDTPTLETYSDEGQDITVETETTTEPGMEFTSDTSPHDNNPSDEMPIIAVMVALSSLLVIIFIIIILYMLRFKKYKQAGSHSNSFRLTNGRSDDTELQSVPLLARSPSTNRKYPPLPVDKLEEEMNRRMADDNKLFREEFNVWHTGAHTL
eukprot:superscaffoldBa00001759_g11899